MASKTISVDRFQSLDIIYDCLEFHKLPQGLDTLYDLIQRNERNAQQALLSEDIICSLKVDTFWLLHVYGKLEFKDYLNKCDLDLISSQLRSIYFIFRSNDLMISIFNEIICYVLNEILAQQEFLRSSTLIRKDIGQITPVQRLMYLLDRICLSFHAPLSIKVTEEPTMKIVSHRDIEILVYVLGLIQTHIRGMNQPEILRTVIEPFHIKLLTRLLNILCEDYVDYPVKETNPESKLNLSSGEFVQTRKDLFYILIDTIPSTSFLKCLDRCLTTSEPSFLDSDHILLLQQVIGPNRQPAITLILNRYCSSPPKEYYHSPIPRGHDPPNTEASAEGLSDGSRLLSDIYQLCKQVAKTAISENFPKSLERAIVLIGLASEACHDTDIFTHWLTEALGLPLPSPTTNTPLHPGLGIARDSVGEGAVASDADENMFVLILYELIPIHSIEMLRAACHIMKQIKSQSRARLQGKAKAGVRNHLQGSNSSNGRSGVTVEDSSVDLYLFHARARLKRLERGICFDKSQTAQSEEGAIGGATGVEGNAGFIVPQISSEKVRMWANTVYRTSELPESMSRLVRICGKRGGMGVLKALVNLIQTQPSSAGLSADKNQSEKENLPAERVSGNEKTYSLRKCCVDIVKAMLRATPPLCSTEEWQWFEQQTSKASALNSTQNRLLDSLQLSKPAYKNFSQMLALLSSATESAKKGLYPSEMDSKEMIIFWRTMSRKVFTDYNNSNDPNSRIGAHQQNVLPGPADGGTTADDGCDRDLQLDKTILRMGVILASSMMTTADSIANSFTMVTSHSIAVASDSTPSKTSEKGSVEGTLEPSKVHNSDTAIREYLRSWSEWLAGVLSIFEGWSVVHQPLHSRSSRVAREGSLGASLAALFVQRCLTISHLPTTQGSLCGSEGAGLGGPGLLLNLGSRKMCVSILRSLFRECFGVKSVNKEVQIVGFYGLIKCSILWSMQLPWSGSWCLLKPPGVDAAKEDSCLSECEFRPVMLKCALFVISRSLPPNFDDFNYIPLTFKNVPSLIKTGIHEYKELSLMSPEQMLGAPSTDERLLVFDNLVNDQNQSLYRAMLCFRKYKDILYDVCEWMECEHSGQEQPKTNMKRKFSSIYHHESPSEDCSVNPWESEGLWKILFAHISEEEVNQFKNDLKKDFLVVSNSNRDCTMITREDQQSASCSESNKDTRKLMEHVVELFNASGEHDRRNYSDLLFYLIDSLWTTLPTSWLVTATQIWNNDILSGGLEPQKGIFSILQPRSPIPRDRIYKEVLRSAFNYLWHPKRK